MDPEDKAKMYLAALDEAQTYRYGSGYRSLDMLRNMRFSSAGMFSAIPAAAVARLAAPGGTASGAWSSSLTSDVARGLDHGYQRSTDWFNSVFESDDFVQRGMTALCDRAMEANREVPLDILFGLNEEVAAACRLERLEDLAGIARLAVRNTRLELVRVRGLFDSKSVPPFESLDMFPTERLYERFSEHSDLFPLLECDDEEKYILFFNLTDAGLIPSGKFTVVCILAARRNVPLHRALQAFAKTHDTRAAIEAWDMPDEYLSAAFPIPTGVSK